jgi:hypothetical protein
MKIAAQLLAPYSRYLTSVKPSQVDLATSNHGEGHKATCPPNQGLPSKFTSSYQIVYASLSKSLASSNNLPGALVELCAMFASPVPTSARKRIKLKGHIGTGSPAKKARQETPPHVSTAGATADLEKGSDDGGSRARSNEDSEVSSHVDAIVEHDSNYPHDLGQVFASDLPSIAGVPSSEGVCPIAVVAACDGGNGVCKNYSERVNSDASGDEASNREPFDEQEGASNGEETKRRISSKQSIPKGASEAFHPSPCTLVQAFGSTSSRPS